MTEVKTDISTMEKLLKFLPLAVIVATVFSAGVVGQFQLGALAGEVGENEASIEQNEEDIEIIQRKLIERQGEISLDLERLRIQQNQQNRKLDDMLQLLRNPITRN